MTRIRPMSWLPKISMGLTLDHKIVASLIRSKSLPPRAKLAAGAGAS
jgi:hypothetical protein